MSCTGTCGSSQGIPMTDVHFVGEEKSLKLDQSKWIPSGFIDHHRLTSFTIQCATLQDIFLISGLYKLPKSTQKILPVLNLLNKGTNNNVLSLSFTGRHSRGIAVLEFGVKTVNYNDYKCFFGNIH